MTCSRSCLRLGSRVESLAVSPAAPPELISIFHFQLEMHEVLSERSEGPASVRPYRYRFGQEALPTFSAGDLSVLILPPNFAKREHFAL